MAESELLVETRGALGLLTLNRPGALNALSEGMVDAIAAALNGFAADDAVKTVAIRSCGGKAFSAGGDIRALTEKIRAGRHAEALDFWRREYRLNAAIKRYAKPYVALIDGIVMGGGVGVSLHGSHRFAGPNYLFAMPEVGIGFFPDVGATYALPRLPGAAGAWLAITGSRIRRADALHLGLATHAVQADSEPGILDLLAAGELPAAVAARFAEPPGEAPIAGSLAAINRHFAGPTLAAIINSLEKAADAGETFAIETLRTLASKSPMSIAIALEQVRRGANLSFEAAMALEFRIVSRLIHDPDFAEGVRALIVDKDNRPNWQPATIGAIDPARLAEHFAPLAAELDLAMSKQT